MSTGAARGNAAGPTHYLTTSSRRSVTVPAQVTPMWPSGGAQRRCRLGRLVYLPLLPKILSHQNNVMGFNIYRFLQNEAEV